MLKRNTVSARSYAREIFSAARAYSRASAKILKRGDGGELWRAASLCHSICAGARSAAKSIAYRKLLHAENGKAEVFTLAEEFWESGDEASEAKLCAFLSSRAKAFESVTLSLLPDALLGALAVRISRLVCAGECEGLSRLLRAAERLHFVDFSRIFLAFSASAQIFSAEKAGVFEDCDDKTKFKYIAALISRCEREGREESELAKEIVKRADLLGVHIGELLFKKRAYVPRVYSACLVLTTLLIAALYFFACGRSALALLTMPAAAIASYGMVKELLSFCFKYAGGS